MKFKNQIWKKLSESSSIWKLNFVKEFHKILLNWFCFKSVFTILVLRNIFVILIKVFQVSKSN